MLVAQAPSINPKTGARARVPNRNPGKQNNTIGGNKRIREYFAMHNTRGSDFRAHSHTL